MARDATRRRCFAGSLGVLRAVRPPRPRATENWRCSSNGNVSKVLLDDRARSPIRLNNELRTCFKSKILEKLPTPSSIDSRCEGSRDVVSISLNAEALRSEVLPASPVAAGSAPFRVPSAAGVLLHTKAANYVLPSLSPRMPCCSLPLRHSVSS